MLIISLIAPVAITFIVIVVYALCAVAKRADNNAYNVSERNKNNQIEPPQYVDKMG